MIKDTSGQDLQVKAPKSKRRYVGLGAALISISSLAYALINSSDGEFSIEKADVQIHTVINGDFVRDISANGKIVAANAPQVFSPEVGFINLLVNAGDRVVKGQMLATLESPELESLLKQQESEKVRLSGELERKTLEVRRGILALTKSLDLARVQLEAAQREARRAQISIEKRLISQIDFEKAEDDLARAQLNYQHAEKEVALGEDTLAYELSAAQQQLSRQSLVVEELQRKVEALKIQAPVDGIVGNLLVQPKSAVASRQALMTLVDLSAFEAELQVPESYANELGLGMDVELKFGAYIFKGQLSAISPEVNNREVTTRVRFITKNLPDLRQNQRLSARILLENKENTLLTKRGQFLYDGGNVAYKVEGNIAKRIAIKVGATSVNEVELLEGVKAGDQIITSNYELFNHATQLVLR